MQVTNYLCIGCPMGCHLEVIEDGDEPLKVKGFSCKRGIDFAKQEHTDPRRMMTTTVRVENGLLPKLPVKTREPIPKDKVVDVCNALHTLQLEAPVSMGDIIMKNALDLGVDVIASRSMPKV